LKIEQKMEEKSFKITLRINEMNNLTLEMMINIHLNFYHNNGFVMNKNFFMFIDEKLKRNGF
jgi:hypothetical protein